MTTSPDHPLPPGQQLLAPHQWPTMGERAPRKDDSPWNVAITGAVRRPCAWGLDDLRSMDQVDCTTDVHCVTRWSKPKVRFRGVPLSVLIDRAEPAAEAHFVSFVARTDRDHSTSLVLADALELGALVALEIDGKPLPVERGGPVRMVVPGRYFYKSLKWLERIELLAEDRLGFWESTAGYHNAADPWCEQRYMAAGLSQAEARAILDARDVAGRQLLGLQAEGRNLAGLVARDALLRNADFRGCDLQRATFDGANLTNAHMETADLRGAQFRGADLEGTEFAGADLRGACLLQASLLGASFCNPAWPATSGAQIDPTTELDPAAIAQLPPVQQAYVRLAQGRSKATGRS